MVTLAATALLIFAACAGAQRETPQTEVDGPIVSEGDDLDREFSDEEVMAFAAAYPEVTAIQQDYQSRIEHADDAERQQLNAESRVKSEETMAEHGISPEEYNAIAIQMRDDDELRGRVQSAMRQMEQQRIEETEQQLENQ